VKGRNIIGTIVIATIVWAVTHFVLMWLPGKHLVSFLIALVGALVVAGIFSLLSKIGLAERLGIVLAVAAVGSVAFLLIGASNHDDWESITIDCSQNQVSVDLDPADVDLDGVFYWKEKYKDDFTIEIIEKINDPGPNEKRTPFRGGLFNLGNKFNLQSIKGRTKGDRAKEEGKFKYKIVCTKTNKILDPIIQIPRPMVYPK
jgi:hypothetical protein